MQARFLFMTFGVFATVYGALLMVAPNLVGNVGTLPAEAEFLAHINQSRAPTMLGLGLLAWLFRDGDAPETPTALTGLIIANVVLAVSLALSQLTPAATVLGWPLTVLHAVWAAGFASLRFGARARRGDSHA